MSTVTRSTFFGLLHIPSGQLGRVSVWSNEMTDGADLTYGNDEQPLFKATSALIASAVISQTAPYSKWAGGCASFPSFHNHKRADWKVVQIEEVRTLTDTAVPIIKTPSKNWQANVFATDLSSKEQATYAKSHPHLRSPICFISPFDSGLAIGDVFIHGSHIYEVLNTKADSITAPTKTILVIGEVIVRY